MYSMYDFIIHAAAAIPVLCSQGPAGPISLKTVHWTVFQALDAPEGQCHQLKEKIPAAAPKRLPLEGKLSAKQTEEVSPYVSFLCRNRRTVLSVDTSSDPPQAAAHLPLKGKAFGDRAA